MRGLMREYFEKKLKAQAEHVKRFECSHAETQLRRRIVGGGQVHNVRQCQRCGAAIGNPVARGAANDACGGKEPDPFDHELKERWGHARDEAAHVLNQRLNEEFWARYRDNLRTPEWTKKRRLVMERARGLCEGCRERPAVEVHHLVYDNLGDESLLDLAALCKRCHDACHPDRVPVAKP